jgi:hypothetical protein
MNPQEVVADVLVSNDIDRAWRAVSSYGDARFKDGLEAAIVEFCGTVCHCRTAERIRSLAAQPPPEEK